MKDTTEPVAWRWRPKGSISTWFYHPLQQWLEEHRDEIDAEPLYSIPAQQPPSPAHVPAAFINALAEEGTKAEVIEYLQKQWNENCALRAELKALRSLLIPAGKQARFRGETRWFGVSDDHDNPESFEYRTIYARTSPECRPLNDEELADLHMDAMETSRTMKDLLTSPECEVRGQAHRDAISPSGGLTSVESQKGKTQP